MKVIVEGMTAFEARKKARLDVVRVVLRREPTDGFYTIGNHTDFRNQDVPAEMRVRKNRRGRLFVIFSFDNGDSMTWNASILQNLVEKP